MINRRQMLMNSAVLGMGAAASLSGITHALAQETRLRLYWWGTPGRAKRTQDVAALFSKTHSGVTINAETAGADYWSKLTTMMAGGNLPDIFQLEPNSFADYGRRKAALPLDSYFGKKIRTERLAPGSLDLCKVDGQISGIPIALNACAMLYDKDIFAKANIAPPDSNTSWEDFAKTCIELTKFMGKDNVWAVGNCAHYNSMFTGWLRQRDKSMYTEDGKLGFTADDATEWYTYWQNLSKQGGCTPAEVQSMDKSLVETNPLTTGNAVIAMTYSNLLPAYQAVYKGPLEITSTPIANKTAPSGLFYRPALIWAISSQSKNQEIAAEFLDYFINDKDAGNILGIERGVPVNLDIQQTITPTIDELAKKTVAYINNIADRVGPYPPQIPLGATEFNTRAFMPIGLKLAYGNLTPAEAGAELISQGKRILKS
ncbi:ABC-type sugar transport system, periplasmic component [Phyllobacterium sp. YR531]|nr:ABC-type sugar transport system, periplasmic component [Phyllobacterium sp. YR531]